MHVNDKPHYTGKLKKDDIDQMIQSLLMPEPLSSLMELDVLIKPLPGYIGPGEWIKLLK